MTGSAKKPARKVNAAFMKPVHSSAALAAVIGDRPMPRTEVTKKLWAYIKKNGLQDRTNRRLIKADGALKPVFGGKATVNMFEMMKLVGTHLTSEEPSNEAFYSLREPPFALTSDPRFFFMSVWHRRAHAALLTSLRRHEGLLVLVGETGTGKTTLCRALIDALGPRTFSALIFNPYMSDEDVVRVMLCDFGIVSRDEIRRGALSTAGMPQLLATLEHFLRSLLPLGSSAVVIIDEAQSLPPQVLDQVRILGSMEDGGRHLLQILLVGQPNLLTTLKLDALRALNERVACRAALGPLEPAELGSYIHHRLSVAGAAEAVTFTADAEALIMSLSRGLPRRVNLLCGRALEEGRLAHTKVITPALVSRAAQSLAGTAGDSANDESAPGGEAGEVAFAPGSTRDSRASSRWTFSALRRAWARRLR